MDRCRRLLWLLLGVCLTVAASAQSRAPEFPVTVVDALKRSVTVQRKPQRIVSIAPSATEILFAIGAGRRVVANTTYCDFPPAAAKLPKIGGYTNPDVEKILARKPDLILGARGNPLDMISQLAALKQTVVTVDATTVDEMLDAIRTIGALAGERRGAAALVAKLEKRRRTVEAKTRVLTAAQRPRVLFLFTPDNLFSAGKGSFIDELIRLGGGENIAAKTKSPWPELSMEMIIAENPQVILVLAGQMDIPDKNGNARPLTSASALAKFRAMPRWASVAAVKNGRVHVLDDDPLTLPGPRLIDGLEATAAAIHPVLFKGGK